MADALSKELGLDQPTQHHGSAAIQHVKNETSESSQPSESDHVPDMEIFDREKAYDQPRGSHDPNRLQHTTSGVDVEQAERDFAELSRELSSISRRISRTQSKGSGLRARDLEKATSASDGTSEDTFDLERTLRGNKEADHAAGIKSKYIGRLLSGVCVSSWMVAERSKQA